MAKTKIADVIVPEIFAPYVVQRTAELSALWTSGIVAPVDVTLGTNLRSGGTTINMPFWNDLTGEEEILSDSTALTPDKISAAQDIAVTHYRGKAWSTNDLAKVLSGDDPMMAIADLVASYWSRRMQAILISTLTGSFAAASMSGKVHDISALSGALAVIGGETFLDALQLMGDAKERLTAVAMHSATETKLAKLNLIEYVRVSDAEPRVPYFMGKRVIVDDGCPVASGVYTTYLFGAGAIGYADGWPEESVETDRDKLAGDDILINRKAFVLHPRGVKWKGTPTGVSPSNTEAATGTNWERVYEAKNIRMVKFVHKIA